MLNAEELVNHLKDKGVSFTIVNEADAKKYLLQNNNYFKLASYRKNYDKYAGGKNDGKYINLEFAYLKDIAIIDMRLRYILVQMALDIEHYIKVDLLNHITDDDHEDGYSIVEDYVASLNDSQKQRLDDELTRNIDSIYCGDIVSKYNNDWPVWAFLEVIPFGRLVSFYKFCANRFNDKDMINTYYQLLSCKDIRNAAAHSSCILNDLHQNTSLYKPNYNILNAIYREQLFPKKYVKKRMSNVRIQQIITMLYVHKEIVTSRGVHKKTAELLNELKRRINEHCEYYNTNLIVYRTFEFVIKIVDRWYCND